ncbi:MAG: 2-amino-4-hydroxy-6-hydroxymethyldihydropteridine diphosphokinase [Taibaiella sp.]|nr:2-amino-4-hydroxy-6-hydroxymethyldihydropteridine diphosphokinase [Taibaiella sp.]
MNTAYLLLGGNEGDTTLYLQSAYGLISASCGAIIQYSPVYQTAAWGLQEQPDFLNQVIAIHTTLSPFILLEKIQDIEKELGRQRTIKWGQRTLDIDILLYDDVVIDTPLLTIPHPSTPMRRFTLAPLAAIAPAYVHPVLKKTIQELLDECPDPLPTLRLDINLH